jgi:hypothetical protein
MAKCGHGILGYIHPGEGNENFQYFQEHGMKENIVYFSPLIDSAMHIRVHITDAFDWKDANAVMLELFLGTNKPLVGLPIIRTMRDQSINLGIQYWPIWDSQEAKWTMKSFKFGVASRETVSNPKIP